MTGELRARFEAAYEAGLVGDFRRTARLLSTPSVEDDEARAYRALLRAQLWFADPTPGQVAEPEALGRFVTAVPTARAVARRAAILCAHRDLLAHDVDRLSRWTDMVESLGGRDPMLDAWLAYASGDLEVARNLSTRPSEAAPVRIEGVALRSFALLDLGDLDQGLKFARQASRMASVEDQPQAQYLASLALARARRLSGMPHLSLRILHALAKVVSAPWRGWVSWELSGCGVPAEESPFSLVLAAAHQGDARAVDDAACAAWSATPAWDSRQADLRSWLAFVDPRQDVMHLPPYIHQFLLGERAEVPGALAGLCSYGGSRLDGPGGTIVCVRPDGEGRRASGIATRLAATVFGGVHMGDSPGRTELALSVLALEGSEGIAQEDFFRKVYGFPYRPGVHRDLFKMLKHRMRRACSGLGTLEVTHGDRLVLRLERPLIMVDPRCQESLEDRMLRFMATGGRSARDAARHLNVNVRTVQLALKHLVDDGVIASQREGRRLTYRVEDTTFREPTRWS